jgi:MFS family permease
LTVTLWVGLSNLIWLPTMGALSDRIGRRPLLIACTLLMLTSAYPAMLWLVDRPSFSRLLAVQLWFSFIFASYNGAMVPFLTEIMPFDFRRPIFPGPQSYRGVFGGFTPAQHT